MALMRELFEQVRTPGTVQFDEPLIHDNLPFVYYEEGGNQAYWNSGGRSIVFERDGKAYKIHGVDPNGHLTRRVSGSKENKLSDVERASEAPDAQTDVNRKTYRSKSFGVVGYDDLERSRTAFRELDGVYRLLGIKPPCEVIANFRVGDNYQLLFGLPSLESDLRVWEFMELVRDRLIAADRSELKAKFPYVKRVFGRLVTWSGFAIRSMIMSGLVPSEDSWVPQNFVLHDIGNGYGAFRVDHTSTIRAGREEAMDYFVPWIQAAMEGKEKGAMFPTFSYCFIPEAAEIAAQDPDFTKKLPVDQSLSPFERVLAYYASDGGSPKNPVCDISQLLDVHWALFYTGFQGIGVSEITRSLAIPEDYMRKILE